MTAQSAGRTMEWRGVPLWSWALIVLASAYLVINLPSAGVFALDTIAAALRFVVAAAIIYVAPADRRYLVAGILIAVYQGTRFVAAEVTGGMLLPVPFVGALVDIALAVNVGVLVAALVLFGQALGSIRSGAGLAVVGLGLALAVAQLVSFFATAPEGLTVVDFASSVLLGPMLPLAWAYLLGSSIDARRRWFITGAALQMTLLVLFLAQRLLPVGPDFALLALVFGALSMASWAALVVAALTEIPRRMAEPAHD